MTYETLFAYLAHLGFEDTSPTASERVFEHSGLRILLAFALPDQEAISSSVRSADITSVEFRLQQHGLLIGPLTDSARRLGVA